MQRVFFLLSVVVSSIICDAQKAGWDSTYRPNQYEFKLSQFRNFANSPHDVIFLGNSITDYNEWHELLQMPHARNRGISGDITFGVLERLDEVTEGQPSKVFILIGINDIARNIPVDIILGNHRKIVQRIKKESPRTYIYLQTLLPVNNTFPKKNHFNQDEKIHAVNHGLKKMAKEEGVFLIDIYPHFLDKDGRLDKNLTYDGLHLNANGYQRWIPLVLEHARPTRFVHPAFNKEGHRGIRGLSPENTIPSMYKAIDEGVHTLELDVVMSKDKKVVVSHDVFFHQDFSLTPQGDSLTAKEAQKHLLYNMNYDSIRKYDVGLKHHPGFPLQEKIATYKPLLSELIDSCDAYAKRQGKVIYYNIELKASPAYDGTKQPPIHELVEKVMEVVRSRNLEARCYLQSFDFRPLQILNQQHPDIETAVLIGGNDKRSFEQQLKELGYIPGSYSPHYSLVTKELLEACHKLGMKVIPWTVNTKEEIKRLKELGVDGIITDFANFFE